MNAQPITVTATVACWVAAYSQRDVLDAIEGGNAISVVNKLALYGPASMEKFSDYIRVGEADVTVRLFPKDEQTRLMVQALNKKLAEERIKWHERQEAILAEISKWSALEYTPADTVEAE